jgi:hypothetical protein
VSPETGEDGETRVDDEDLELDGVDNDVDETYEPAEEPDIDSSSSVISDGLVSVVVAVVASLL